MAQKGDSDGEDLLSKLFDMDQGGDSDPTISAKDAFGSKTNVSDLKEKTDASPKKSSSVELGDNLFDGILEDEDGTIADNKINFFDDIKSKADDSIPTGPAVTDVKESTILLDKPLASSDMDATAAVESLAEESEAEATQFDDPIDRALRQSFEPDVEAENLRKMAKPKASAPMGMGGANAPRPEVKNQEMDLKSSLMDDLSQSAEETPTDQSLPAQRVEVSAKEFSEVFSTGPIQVPDASMSRPKRISPKIFQYATYAVILLGLFSGLGLVYVKAKSDQGLMGYRVEGFKVVQAYQAPDEAALKEFGLIFESAKEARLSDSPEKIEAAIASLKSILQKDERNFEAAAAIAEHSAILTDWYGLTSAWAQRYDEALQIVGSIQSKNPILPSQAKIALDRARIWRMLSVRDLQKAQQEILTTGSDSAAASNAEFSILKAQLAMELSHWDEIAKDLQTLSPNEKDNPRVQWLQALGKLSSNPEQARTELQTLGDKSYLPGKVYALIFSPLTKENANDLIKKSDSLLESVKNYPKLNIKVLDFRGDVYAVLDQDEKARAEWKTLTEIASRDSKIWLKLADSYEEAALWDEAIEAFRSAQKLEPLKLEDLLRFAQLLRIRGKIVEAMTLLDQGMAAYPKAGILHYEKGKVQLAVYQDDAAKISYKKALEIDPKLEQAGLGLADLAFQKKEYPEAEALYKKILPQSEFYSKALRGLGLIAEIKHQDREAEHYYEQALKVNPKLEALYPHLVEIYLTGERDQEAEALVDRGLKIMPKSPLLKVSLAKVYQFQTRTNDALHIIEPLLKKYEHVLEVQFTAADLYIDKTDFDAAWEVLKPMLTKELRDAELLYLKARFFYLNSNGPKYGGSMETAQRSIELAVRRDPENEKYRILASQIAVRVQDRALAMDHVEYVLRFRPQSAKAYVMQGNVYLDNMEYEKASRSFQEALKLTRFQAPIYRRLADAYKALGRTALSIQYYEKVLKQQPNDASVHLVLGKLYNEEGKTSLATSHFQKTIENAPEEPDAYYYLGFILKEAGDRRGAIRNLEKFLSLRPSGKESATIRDELYFLKGSQAN